MSFLPSLERELRERRLPARERRRILAEYADHLACDPASAGRLGDPVELAGAFAAERSADGARRGAVAAVVALAITAVALVVGQLAVGHAGGYQSFGQGRSTALALAASAAVLLGPQVALVAGGLALLRAVRRRRARTLPDDEVALIHRRCIVALVAGLATAAGMLALVADGNALLATWWLWLQAGLAVAAAVALLVALRPVLRSRRIVGGVPGRAGDLGDDLPLPSPLRSRPWWLGGLVAGAAALLAFAAGAHAESSLVEGLERGLVEGLAVIAGYALLGRALGARPDSGPTVDGPRRARP